MAKTTNPTEAVAQPDVTKTGETFCSLPELEGLFAATTQGEWRTMADSYTPAEWFIVAGSGCFGGSVIAGPSEAMSKNPDYDWIVAMHNSFPDLISNLRRCWQLLASVDMLCDNAGNNGTVSVHLLRKLTRSPDDKTAVSRFDVKRSPDCEGFWWFFANQNRTPNCCFVIAERQIGENFGAPTGRLLLHSHCGPEKRLDFLEKRDLRLEKELGYWVKFQSERMPKYDELLFD